MSRQLKFNFIIPCYNEEMRFPGPAFAAYYADRPDISFCFVNDGSTDNTLSLLNSLAKGREDRIAVISLPSNAGKAEAVRTGILHALHVAPVDYVGFIDADLATPPTEIDHLLSSCIYYPDSSIVFGSRIKRPGVQILRSPKRHYLGRVFANVVKLFLGIHLYDTQCGAKLIRSSVAVDLFHEPFISRWLFDLELFLRAAALPNIAAGAFVECPLDEWTETGSSRLGAGAAVDLIRDFIAISLRYGRIPPLKRLLFCAASTRRTKVLL